MASMIVNSNYTISHRPKRTATILAIGTATPDNCILQSEYPDYYFRVTNSEHKIALKQKFKRICEKSTIRKRHLHLTEDILNQNPNITKFNAPSLNTRQDIATTEVPKLAEAAALAAINDWRQPKSSITHLIFLTTCGVDMPGADFRLLNLLQLPLTTNRLMIYQAGCHGGGTALRLAKDIAENNAGSRVLVVCAEITAVSFHAPSETYLDSLIGQALFSDGAAALIVGAGPDLEVTETPIFEIVSAGQTLVPDSGDAVSGQLREIGVEFHLSSQIPNLIASNIERCLVNAFAPIGVNDWNELFWIAHPGGPAILNRIEFELGLEKEKLEVSREVLREYGNVLSCAVIFVLDAMRRRKGKEKEEGKVKGVELEWGVLFGFGPGLTIETVVLRCIS